MRLSAAQYAAGADGHRGPGRGLRAGGAGDAAQATGIGGVAGGIAQHRAHLPGAGGNLAGVPGHAGIDRGAVEHLPGQYPSFAGFQGQYLAGLCAAGGGQLDLAAGGDGHAVEVQCLTGSHHHVAQGGAGRALGPDADLVVGHGGLVECDGAAELLLRQRPHRVGPHRLAVGRLGHIGQGVAARQAACGPERAAGTVHIVRHGDALVVCPREHHLAGHQSGADAGAAGLVVDGGHQGLQVRGRAEGRTDHRCAGVLRAELEADGAGQRQLVQTQAGPQASDERGVDRRLAPVHHLDGFASGDVGARGRGVGHWSCRVAVEGAGAAEVGAEHLQGHTGRVAGVVDRVKHMVGGGAHHPLINQVAARRGIVGLRQACGCGALKVAGAARRFHHAQAGQGVANLDLAAESAAGIDHDGFGSDDLAAAAEQGGADGRSDADVGPRYQLDPAACQEGGAAVVGSALRHPQCVVHVNRFARLHLQRQSLVGLLGGQGETAAGLEAHRQGGIHPITGGG